MDSVQANSRALPPHLTTILDDLDKSDEAARRLAGGLSDAQVNWQPGETAWSIAQCLDHLGRANTVYAAALHQAVKESGAKKETHPPAIRPGWLGRLFIGYFEPPPRKKLRAPKKIVPASRMGCREVLEAFLRWQQVVRRVIRHSVELDMNMVRFHEAFIRLLRFTVGT